MQQQRHKEEMASEKETSSGNCLEPHFYAVKFCLLAVLKFIIDQVKLSPQEKPLGPGYLN